MTPSMGSTISGLGVCLGVDTTPGRDSHDNSITDRASSNTTTMALPWLLTGPDLRWQRLCSRLRLFYFSHYLHPKPAQTPKR